MISAFHTILRRGFNLICRQICDLGFAGSTSVDINLTAPLLPVFRFQSASSYLGLIKKRHRSTYHDAMLAKYALIRLVSPHNRTLISCRLLSLQMHFCALFQREIKSKLHRLHEQRSQRAISCICQPHHQASALPCTDLLNILQHHVHPVVWIELCNLKSKTTLSAALQEVSRRFTALPFRTRFTSRVWCILHIYRRNEITEDLENIVEACRGSSVISAW